MPPKRPPETERAKRDRLRGALLAYYVLGKGVCGDSIAGTPGPEQIIRAHQEQRRKRFEAGDSEIVKVTPTEKGELRAEPAEQKNDEQ